LVPLAEIGPSTVVVVQPSVEIGLSGFQRFVEGLAHLWLEELLQHGAVEALDEAVRFRRAYFGLAVLDLVEGQVELVGVPFGAAEFAAPPRSADRVSFREQLA